MAIINGWTVFTGFDWEKVQLKAFSLAFGMKVSAEALENLMLHLNTNLIVQVGK